VRCRLLWNCSRWRGHPSSAPAGGSDACHGSSDAVPLADRGRHDEPEVALAAVGAGSIQSAVLLHVNHEGVDGALVAAGVHAHGANQVAAGHRAVFDQAGADRGADDGGQHLGGCGCLLMVVDQEAGVNPSRSAPSRRRHGHQRTALPIRWQAPRSRWSGG